MSSIQIARYIVSFSWIYHGLFPKIIQISPLEKLMTASLGFNDDVSYFITKFAGVSEIIFGLVLFVFYKKKLIVIVNILGLFGLLSFVGLLQSQLLIEAFNPVTTNIPIIGLSFILLNALKTERER